MGGAAVGAGPNSAPASEAHSVSQDWNGVLMDITKCIGCRRCEAACKEANGFDVPTDRELEDKSVFAELRRPEPDGYTVINSYPNRSVFRLGADFQEDLNRAADISSKRLEAEAEAEEPLARDSGTAEAAISERLAEEFSQNGVALTRAAIVTADQPGRVWALTDSGRAYLVKHEDGALDVREMGPTFVKANCFHCNNPACVSACIVGAFRKLEDGPVVYDAWKCMGCRYCMVACPFQIPTYEYDNVLTPQVRKCTLCANEGNPNKGGVPACVRTCPKECMTYGPRSELLARAHQLIEQHPDIYNDHVYGEHEVGGTSWLYLGPKEKPFTDLGFIELDHAPPPLRTERIQHGVFKYFVPPLAWYGLLGAVMWVARPDADGTGHGQAEDHH